jgi:hypothetical protein
LAAAHAKLYAAADVWITEAAMQDAAGMLRVQFLAWVSGGPRTYSQAMDAWQSSCPRLTIWEDAIIDGLVKIERGADGSRGAARVTLTARGKALLNGH